MIIRLLFIPTLLVNYIYSAIMGYIPVHYDIATIINIIIIIIIIIIITALQFRQQYSGSASKSYFHFLETKRKRSLPHRHTHTYTHTHTLPVYKSTILPAIFTLICEIQPWRTTRGAALMPLIYHCAQMEYVFRACAVRSFDMTDVSAGEMESLKNSSG